MLGQGFLSDKSSVAHFVREIYENFPPDQRAWITLTLELETQPDESVEYYVEIATQMREGSGTEYYALKDLLPK